MHRHVQYKRDYSPDNQRHEKSNHRSDYSCNRFKVHQRNQKGHAQNHKNYILLKSDIFIGILHIFCIHLPPFSSIIKLSDNIS